MQRALLCCQIMLAESRQEMHLKHANKKKVRSAGNVGIGGRRRRRPPPPDRLRSIIPQVDNLLRYRPNVSQKKNKGKDREEDC